MAKKKNTTKAPKKAQKLEFKDKFINSNSKMYGDIKGVQLPKMFKEFTEDEKNALYWHNPTKTGELFKNVSFLGPRKLTKDEEKPKPPTVEDETKEETNNEQ